MPNLFTYSSIFGFLVLAFEVPSAASVQAPDPELAGVESSASVGGLGEIIVTASRRAENMQRESRSIVAIGAEELSRTGATDPSALQTLVSGVSIAQIGPQVQIFIRGVGDRTISAATDPAVAINVDGVFYPKAFALNGAFFDLERIEVLKGPQGTLYGRNASAGAINLITAKPKFEFGGFAEAEYGNYDSKRFTMAITGPVSDTLAIRFAGQYIDRDGYLSDGYNDDNNIAIRTHILWKPDVTTSIILSGYYSTVDSKGDSAVILPDRAGIDHWTGPSDAKNLMLFPNNHPIFGNVRGQPNKYNFYQNIKTFGFTGQFDHSFGFATLTVIPSFLQSHLVGDRNVSVVVPTYQDTNSKQKSIEARMSSSDASKLKWVMGAFGSIEKVNDQNQSDQITILLPTFRPRLDDKSWAVFGEGTYSITDLLRIIGGVRYTWEKKIVEGVTGSIPFVPGLYPLPGPVSGQLDISGKRTDNAINFRAGVEYDIASQSMLYGTVSTGFKAGGFFADIAIPGRPNSYAPEKLTAYQLGVKSRLFNNRLQLNIEGYYWDYKDKQETYLAPAASGGTVLTTSNAGKVTLYGADVSIIGLLTENNILSADISYNHNKYDKFSFVQVAGPSVSGCVDGPTNDGLRVRDCGGFPLVRAPKWSGTVGFQHTHSLGDGSELLFNVATQFASKYYLSTDFLPVQLTEFYHTTDLSLSWKSASNKVTITAWIKNLEDEPVYTGGSSSPAAPGLFFATIRPPRTYGGRVRYNF